MIEKEKRETIVNLHEKGLNITEIAKKVGVSRHSVYRIIQNDSEVDPEIQTLKKNLEKAKLEKSIREVKRPFATERQIEELTEVMDIVISMVLTLYATHHNPKVRQRPPFCPYCDSELEYGERENRRGKIIPEFTCQRCRKIFPFQ